MNMWGTLLILAITMRRGYSQNEVPTCLSLDELDVARHECPSLLVEVANTTDKSNLCSIFLDQLACVADYHNISVDVCRQELETLTGSGHLKYHDDFNPMECPCFDGYNRVTGPCLSSICSQDGASCEEKMDISVNLTVCCVDRETFSKHFATERPVTVKHETPKQEKLSGAVIAIIVSVVIIAFTLGGLAILVCLRQHSREGIRNKKQKVEVYTRPNADPSKMPTPRTFDDLEEK